MLRPLAIFTIVQNEPVYLPIWVRHYLSKVECPADLHILDHQSVADGAQAVAAALHRGITVTPVTNSMSFDHVWLRDTVKAYQRKLLEHYKTVIFTEVDELVLPAPSGRYQSLLQLADENIGIQRCRGYEVVQHLRDRTEDKPVDFSSFPLLAQRKWWYACRGYSKPLLTQQPADWINGFHHLFNPDSNPPTPMSFLDPRISVNQDILLVHIHKIDFEYCLRRNQEAAARQWNPADFHRGGGKHNRIVDRQALVTYFRQSYDNKRRWASLELIPDDVRALV